MSTPRIAVAVAASLLAAMTATTAYAVTLNPRGLGQALIFPYYTVNNSQDTLISVANASDVGKVINVLVREGMNGRDALYFRLFLSPNDVWTARVSELGSDDGAAIFTSDHSCTFPKVAAAGAALLSDAYTGNSVYPSDGGPVSVMRTREGSIELIEVGSIIPGSPLDATTTHAQSGQPNAGVPICDTAFLGNNTMLYMDAPSGGLFGSASIVNVGEGTFFAYAAQALADFSEVPLDSGSMPLPGQILGMANSAESSVDGGAIANVIDSDGHIVALDYVNSLDAVSAVFMADSIANEYLVGAGLGANTDWIVTFPTRQFYVDPYYVGNEPVPPFVDLADAALSNIELKYTIYDQEEGFISPPDFGAGVRPFRLPYQVNAISFRTNAPNGAPSGVFGSTLVTDMEHYGAAGWIDLDMANGDGGHALRPDANGNVLHGLPVVGFMVYNIINANAAPGRLANYGGVFPHRSTVACSNEFFNFLPIPCFEDAAAQ